MINGGIKSLEIIPHKKEESSVYDKGPKAMQWKKERDLNKEDLAELNIHMQINESRHRSLEFHQNMNSVR